MNRNRVKKVERGVAQVLHETHGGTVGHACFLCRTDARAIVAMLVAHGLLLASAVDKAM